MNYLKGAACVAVIAASGVYLNNQNTAHKADVAAQNFAAIELCLHKRAEAEKYRGGMDWTGAANIKYVNADAYCN